MPTTPNTDWKPGDPIGYVNPQIPEFETPPYRGERYEAMAPDTLDIAERARLALNALTEATDPQADYEVYPILVFRSNPPHMFHNSWPIQPKFMEAASMMRLITGSDRNLHVDHAWMQVALKCMGPDGLIYTPLKGRPWAFVWWPGSHQASDYTDIPGQFLNPFQHVGMINAMVHFAKRDDSGVWRDAVRRAVDGAIAAMVDKGDMAAFWPSFYIATSSSPATAEMPVEPFECEATWIPHSLVRAYRLLDYEPALTLARKSINHTRRHFYAPDGSFIASPGVPWRAHFHARARGLLTMQEYAETANDQELMQFVVSGYEYAKAQLANYDIEQNLRVVRTPGAELVGFFPEWANSPMGEKGETCQLSDMIAVALRLSEAGVADYWDDADRWIRNQFAEDQLTNVDWLDSLPKDVPIEPYSSTDRVPERNLGAFSGAPDPNDWTAGVHMHVVGHCCTANGSRALYWIWERILRHDDGKLRINLLLNRASRWADIDSYIPYQGRVEVKTKQPVDLSMRIPEWVTPSQTRCQVNGGDRSLGWDGRYAKIGQVKPDDIVTLTFPIAKRTDRVHIQKRPYTLVRKGNEVIHIDPPGRHCPLYQRRHYGDDTARWRKVERFVTGETIDL